METVSSRLDLTTINLFEKVLKENRSEVVRELVESGREHNVYLNLELEDAKQALETARKIL